MSHAAGAKYPEMLIKEYFFDDDPSFHNNWTPNTLHLRYDAMITIPTQ